MPRLSRAYDWRFVLVLVLGRRGDEYIPYSCSFDLLRLLRVERVLCVQLEFSFSGRIIFELFFM